VRLITAILLAAVMLANAEQTRAEDGGKTLRYAVIGDSYSIGEGATERQSWPALLARHLMSRVRRRL